MSRVTACVLDCPDRCSILCRVGAEGLRLQGNPEHPYTRGFTCAKIRRYPRRLASPHRIREPWVRDGAGFRAATWDEALNRVADALGAALAHDPASVVLVRGSGSMGVSKAFVGYVLSGLGARGTWGALCDEAGIAAIEADAGRLDMSDPLEIDAAEAVVLWGKHPEACSIHTAAQVRAARRRGAAVVAVNPDAGAVARLADRVVCPAPGTDRFLALACAKLLLADPGRPPPWDRVADPGAFEALLARHSLAELLAACGVAEADARALAALYRRTPRVATLVGWGLQRYAFGAENVRAIHALALLAGSVGIPGGGLYYSVLSSRHLPRPLPPARGSAAAPLLAPQLGRELAGAAPPARVLWFSCSNALNQSPDAKALAAAVRRVPTVVAVEPFWTETARRATVVLPPALWLEEEDLVGSSWHNTVAAARRVLDAPDGCRTDFEIAAEVARRVGLDQPFGAVDDWLAACLPPGLTLAEVRARGWARVPWPRAAWADGSAHPDGRFRLLPTLSPEPPTDPRYPLRLLTLIRREALHSQLLPEAEPGPLPVRLHPETAARLGLGPGSPVRVVSRVGELEGEVHLDPGLHPGAVACPRGGWASLGQGVNEATEDAVTDLGGSAAYYATGVRLERVAGQPTPT